jgi:hypothetical protein
MLIYKILCKSDLNKEITISELLSNDKISKVIKSEYAKGFRNVTVVCSNTTYKIKIETLKEIHTFEVNKDDFADILVLAEEHAMNNKLTKKDCEQVELIDIKTI